jgi:hypothetical protein
MARPERNSVDYFPFYCEEGKKMFYIEQTYGNDGFAVFVKLLRELAKTEYHYLDLRDETTLMFLSAKCSVKTELMTAIINDLVKLNKFHKELWEQHKIIWCQDFIDSIQDAYIRRNNKCITFDGLCMKLSIKCNTKTKLKLKNNDNNTQSKLEYIIEEEIKEEKEFIKTWKNDFETYKEQLREAYKQILTPEYIKERQIYHPKLNIKLSIEKAIKDYWITEKAWLKKKKDNIVNINWLTTFNNALCQKSNQVWLQKENNLEKDIYTK